MIPPNLSFFLKIAVAIQGLLWFHINFWNICSGSVKHAIGILVEIALNLQIALGSMDILMMLIFPIHEHVICFHLFVSSSVSFLSVSHTSFKTLVKLIPRYFCFIF